MGWLKSFKDHSNEIGTDLMIENKEASWSKGRLEGITSVEIFNKNVIVLLTMENTDWYQYDRFEVNEEGLHKKIFTAVQAKIKEEHKFISKISSSYFYSFIVSKVSSSDTIIIEPNWINQWITLVLPDKNLPFAIISMDKGKITNGIEIFR